MQLLRRTANSAHATRAQEGRYARKLLLDNARQAANRARRTHLQVLGTRGGQRVDPGDPYAIAEYDQLIMSGT